MRNIDLGICFNGFPAMNIQTLIFRYTFFSCVAMFANLGVQRLVLWLGDTQIFLGVALVTGTVFGLVSKYLLDKRWIFYDVSNSAIQHGKKFGLYVAMGIITTIIFWGMEVAFWLTWRTEAMREIGAVIGLSIGYITKYKLDKKFVFNNRQLVSS